MNHIKREVKKLCSNFDFRIFNQNNVRVSRLNLGVGQHRIHFPFYTLIIFLF
ncbi:hypothetical protein HanIR_Chr14g0720951 [Helianthus annuus]|nr:hypothetical protein HanIR_Chr14g0720951 [Helianthus annuus]